MNESQKKAWKKYTSTEKGKSAIKRYQQSEKYKASQKRYHQTEKYKKRIKDHPEIYKPTREQKLTGNTGKILLRHDNDLQDDPEKLSLEFICKISGIIKRSRMDVSYEFKKFIKIKAVENDMNELEYLDIYVLPILRDFYKSQ
jgi:hypothetical protein